MKENKKDTTKENKRLNSTVEYIDALSDKYSKLNIVRMDLSYKKDDNNKASVTLEEANKDFNRMLNNKRSKPSIFKNQVGYIVKKEYTKDKGVHFHGVFIFDGQKVQKSSNKAEQIGKYWNDTITKDKGSYHNCNRNKYKKNGIGMLNHNDTEKRKILDEDVLSYLCKDEQKIDSLKINKKDRSFVRGTIPKVKSKVGRPRG